MDMYDTAAVERATLAPPVAAIASERVDGEIAALRDRLELLSSRMGPVLQASLPQPARPDEYVTSDSPVGDHSSPLAQSQWTRANQISGMTALVNELLERLEI